MISHVSVVAALMWLGCATAAEPAKLSQAEAEHLVFQCWREVTVEQNGEKKEGAFGHCFTSKGGPCWPLSGELTAGGDEGRKILIDGNASPMRIDFVFTSGKEEWVSPCIFKFEMDRLVIVKPGRSTPFRKDGNYPIRPTGFEATKDNTKKVLKKCEYLEQD
jgi:hypothetical protein